MLAAHCPQCGAASPVSLAEPELLDCSFCPYVGRPPEPVVQELYAARQALHAMDGARRQLSQQQRRAVQRARNSQAGFAWLLAFLLLPLLLCGGTCTVAAVASGLAVSDLPFLLMAIAPAGLVLVMGGLLLRSHKRQVAKLCGSCAAVPPAAQGRPAMCHVCGAPLLGHAERGVTRCNYCHADNVIDAEIMRLAATQHGYTTSALAQAVAQEAASLSSQSTTKMTLTLVLALASPFLGILVGLILAFMMALVPLPPEPNETYVVARVAGTQCYGEFKGSTLRIGDEFPHAILSSAGPTNKLPRIKANQLVGREVLRPQNQPVKISRLSRNLLNDTNMLDLTDGVLDPIGACEKPPELRTLSTDDRLQGCTAVYPQGAMLYIVVQSKVFAVPKSGGEPTQVAGLTDVGSSALAGNRLVHLSGANLEIITLDGTSGQQATAAPAQGVKAISAAGNRIVYATSTAVFAESVDQKAFTQVTSLGKPASSIAANATHVFWVGDEGLMSVPLVGGAQKQLDDRRYLTSVDTLGQRLMTRGSGCDLVPLSGGARSACPFPATKAAYYRGPTTTDTTHAYLVSTSSNDRSGVLAFSLADPSLGFSRLYGPTSKQVTCAGIDDEYVYWVDGKYLQRDKKQQP